MRWVSDSESFEIFRQRWEGLRSRFFKLETQQVYKEDEFYFDEFARWYRDEKMENIMRRVSDRQLREAGPFLRQAEERGINLQRVHIVRLPLSEYLQYEMVAYRINEAHGEHIFILTEDEAHAGGVPPGIPDFMLFDDDHVITHVYEEGELKYSKVSDAKEDILQFIDVREKLLAVAPRLNRWMATHDPR